MGADKQSTKKRTDRPSKSTVKSKVKSNVKSTPPPGDPVSEPCVVRRSPIHGRGVFATRDITVDEDVHIAPLILLNDDEHDMLTGTNLEGYVYDWADGGVGFALGLGSVFNHSRTPNLAYYPLDDDHPAAPGQVYTALREIAAGEELTIDYSGEGEVELWFDE